MITALVKYEVWQEAEHWAFNGQWVTRSKVVTVKKPKKINKMFNNITDIKILKNESKETIQVRNKG